MRQAEHCTWWWFLQAGRGRDEHGRSEGRQGSGMGGFLCRARGRRERMCREAKRCGGLVLLERAFEIRGALGNQWLDSVREVGEASAGENWQCRAKRRALAWT